MNNNSVIIITGNEMDSISNQTFKLDVHPMCDHSYILSDFMEQNKIIYTYFDYVFAHDLVKMAILSNIVMFISGNVHILSLPDEITDFQLEKLNEYKNYFMNDKSVFCIINIKKEEKKLLFEEYSTSIAQEIYENLIGGKNKKWQSKKEDKIKQKDFLNPL